jgi:hypothetical protein
VKITGTATATPGNNGTLTSTATCPAGKVATGGGFLVTAPDAAMQVTASQPGTGETWTASLTKLGSGGSATTTVKAFVVCA